MTNFVAKSNTHNDIMFNEETHQYININDGRELISVTQLMQKHGLAPDYSNINVDTLNAKAERGKLIHKEIESYIKTNFTGFTPEVSNFINYVNEHNVKCLASEMILHNDIVAGTCDLILNYGTGSYTIADIKTTSTIHKDAVSWQLSIYAYLTGNPIVNKGQVFHFNEDSDLKVVDIPLKSYEEIDKLMDCERKGEIYNANNNELVSQVISNEDLQKLSDLENYIKYIDAQKKEAEAKEEELKFAILSKMEEKGLISLDFENLKLTVVGSIEKKMIDSTRLKKEMPEIAEKYTKTSVSKSYLKITIKDNK